jgi:signal transduction histidine kinase
MGTSITTNKMAETLLHSNKELEAFIYSASHDLKGPLAASKGLVDLALSSPDPKEIKDYLDLIGRSLDKLDDLLATLHEVALIRQGQLVIKKVNLESILITLLNNFKAYPKFGNIKFIIRNEVNKEFYSDEIAIQTILRNIIENAIKYINPEAEDPFIKILVRDVESGVLIDVMDNGIGILKKFHNKVFDSFFRATNIASGSGLGLYIVKNAINKLDGKIEIIKSESNQGTHFQLFLPGVPRVGFH